MLIVEPGETHTFIDSSDDYLHFVIQAPFVKGDKTAPQADQSRELRDLGGASARVL